MYSNANRLDDLGTLIVLSENESRVNLNDKLYAGTWLSKPKTLGDVAFIQIFKIIQKKIKEISFGEKIRNTDKNFILSYDRFIEEINQHKILETVCKNLSNYSDAKKDVAILVLLELANSQRILKRISTSEYLKVFIDHAKCFKKMSNYFILF